MDYQKIIKKLSIFKNKPIEIERIQGGVTNANFKVTDGQKKYVAKFGFESNKRLGVNRKIEIHNQKLAAKLGVTSSVISFNKTNNLLLVEYLEGQTVGREKLREKNMIIKVARMMKKVHKGPKFKGIFDPFVASRNYFKQINFSTILPPTKNLLQDLSKLKVAFGKVEYKYPGHLDLVPLNILENGKKVKLLDWEYSAMSDYRFDLAMLSSYADFEPKHDKLLIKSYGQPSLNLEKLNIAKAIMLIREIGWDLVQLKYSELDFDYKKYALDYLRRYKRIMKDLKFK